MLWTFFTLKYEIHLSMCLVCPTFLDLNHPSPWSNFKTVTLHIVPYVIAFGPLDLYMSAPENASVACNTCHKYCSLIHACTVDWADANTPSHILTYCYGLVSLLGMRCLTGEVLSFLLASPIGVRALLYCNVPSTAFCITNKFDACAACVWRCRAFCLSVPSSFVCPISNLIILAASGMGV